MSDGKGGYKTWQKTVGKLICTGGKAVLVIDTAHKEMDTYHRSHQEHSRGINSKQRSPSELPKPCAPSEIPAMHAHLTSSYYSAHQRSAHHERKQDSGHPPAGPNSDSAAGWPTLKFPPQPQPQKSPSRQRNLGAEFEQEQQVRKRQPETDFENRALESQGHAELNSGVHNASQRLTPFESHSSVQGHPGGSYADDGTGPSPKILLETFAGVKEALNIFTKYYIASMKGDMAEWQVLEESIKKDVTVKTSRENHWKFVVQAYISSRLFEGFDQHDYGLDGIQDYTKDECFQKFRDCNDKVETISRLLSTEIPADSFLSKFCFQKYKRVVENPSTKGPFLSHNSDWKDIENALHPNTRFYCSFLKVAISVWLLHRLRFSFEQKTSSINFLKGDGFNTMCMESVVPYCKGEGDDDDDTEQKGGEDYQNLVVGFVVLPGLQVSEAVAKSEVYLVPVEALDKVSVNAGKSSILDVLSPEESSDGHADYALVDGVQEDTLSSLQQNNRSSNEQISTPAKLKWGESETVSHTKDYQKSRVEGSRYMEATISSKNKTSPTVRK